MDSSWILLWILFGSFSDSSWILWYSSWILLGSFLDPSWILLGFFLDSSMDSSWILLGSFLDPSWILLEFEPAELPNQKILRDAQDIRQGFPTSLLD